MSALKTWVVAVLAWGVLATGVQAAPISFLWDWTAWVSQAGVREGVTATPNAGAFGGSPIPSGDAPVANTGPTSSPNPPTPSSPDAYLNFGTSSYPEQSALAVGTAQPWYDSAAVEKAFGHTPNAQEQQSFINGVVSDVQHTFVASGLTGPNTVSLTTDPNASALHTLSIVSGLSYAPNPNAVGITDVGANGFSFIDKFAYASSPDQLEWAVAHNVTHELMHAFGVAIHHDQTGNYLDAATAQWSLLIDPNATLSPATVQDIIAHNIGRNGSTPSAVGAELIDGGEEILAPVPEPATIASWGLATTGLFIARCRHKRVDRQPAA
jgi:hypothetical protein